MIDCMRGLLIIKKYVRQKLDNGGTINRMHENGAGTSLSLGSD
jgi:hypothetical protein